MRALRRAVKILPKFVCQDQRSKVKVTSDKKTKNCNKQQQAIRSVLCVTASMTSHPLATLMAATPVEKSAHAV